MKKRNDCQKQRLTHKCRRCRIPFLTATVKQPALLKTASPITNPMKEVVYVCVWGGIFIY